MILANIISFIGKHIYPDEYLKLKDKLLDEYRKLYLSEFKDRCETLVQLLISGEDHRFRYHPGFDIIAMARAIKNRILYKKTEGASTIEQQLVRVLTNQYQKTLGRKVKEIFLSTTLSQLVPREDIPKIYLQVAYYGKEMSGLKEILKKFNVSNEKNLTVNICAEIIARIKYPESKGRNEKRLRQIELRKNHLLGLLGKHSSYRFFKIYG